MSVLSKVKHTNEQVVGSIKERTGLATGDERLEVRGRTRRIAGKFKSAGDTVADRIRRLGRRVKR
jgi:uncharacterized protein YjbJ (UPF0337 family)